MNRRCAWVGLALFALAAVAIGLHFEEEEHCLLCQARDLELVPGGPEGLGLAVAATRLRVLVPEREPAPASRAPRTSRGPPAR